MKTTNPPSGFLHIEPGIYQHYKGKSYEVIGVALHTETQETVVMYKPLYDAGAEYFVRPYGMFIDTVTIDGVATKRFAKID